MEKPRIYTIKEAASLIDGLTEWRVRQMCQSGELKCFRSGKKYMISEQALFTAVFGKAE
jgi:excisionase family DNA binding protein